MRRVVSVLLGLSTLVPAVAVVAAVSVTPRSADALPVFEFASDKGPIRVTASDLGVRKVEGELIVDDKIFARSIATLQRRFRRPAVPGTYVLKPDHKVVLKPGVPGYEIDPGPTKQMLVRAIHGSRSNLTLPLRPIKAPPAADNAIVVSLREFRLDLYKGSVLAEHFPVGVGALRFPTPPGAYYVRSKAINPTWRNPGSPWARGMPSYIPPGPRNPLGTRALRLDRGALVIHGTPQPWTIGSRSSHGCIRMRRPDVERLFDLVPEQTPVFIVP